MCSGFFVRQGRKRAGCVSSPTQWSDEDTTLAYVGQFYQKNLTWFNEVLIPQDSDEEAVKALMDTKDLTWREKQLVNLAK